MSPQSPPTLPSSPAQNLSICETGIISFIMGCQREMRAVVLAYGWVNLALIPDGMRGQPQPMDLQAHEPFKGHYFLKIYLYCSDYYCCSSFPTPLLPSSRFPPHLLLLAPPTPHIHTVLIHRCTIFVQFLPAPSHSFSAPPPENCQSTPFLCP
uniref:Uncharacterized protein n=1 Tax=Pipistrellus kuhlii TaxID=59472 RepID=A0A7J8B147_PIPKU|nr:hypothetical protein mPipKuh1_007653 [Pipistrellus kuhlii]